MTRKEKHTDRIASRSCSIDQSHVVVVVANLFFIRRVREIPRRRRRRVGRRKRPTHRRHRRRRRQSQNRSTSSTRTRDEHEYDATRTKTNARVPRNDVHQSRAVTSSSNGVHEPPHASRAHARRIHPHDPRPRPRRRRRHHARVFFVLPSFVRFVFFVSSSSSRSLVIRRFTSPSASRRRYAKP